MRILLIEDNENLSEWLARTLRRERFVVDCAVNGEEGLELFNKSLYDLLLLDLHLPKVSGESVLKVIRESGSTVPILIISAGSCIESRVKGLNCGADDYLGKPFEMVELLARMRALIRRSSQKVMPTWNCGKLKYDSNTRQFWVDEDVIPLTPKESAVLEILMQRQGQTVSKQVVCERIYSAEDIVSMEAIEVYMHRLRRKLEKSEATIITLRGLGYLLKPL